MLTISNQSDYGILFLEYLSNKKNYVPLSKLVEATKLPRRFLARISATLARKGIVKSKEGKVGGYKLAVNLKKISLYDYLKIFEKDVEMTKCTNENYDCPYDKFCAHKKLLSVQLNDIVVRELKKTKLSGIL